jgi:hypothetical protein
MIINKIAISDFWWISYTGDIKHYGKVSTGQQLTTSQENYEEFDNEADYLKRCEELGIDADNTELGA